MTNLYDTIPELKCIQGDTLPAFNVTVTGASSLSGCTMLLIMSRHSPPNTAVLTKSCPLSDDTFSVVLDSTDTASLVEDLYDIHFRLVDPQGLSHRKLCGQLYVSAVPQGGAG
jgi:hypothetical protein